MSSPKIVIPLAMMIPTIVFSIIGYFFTFPLSSIVILLSFGIFMSLLAFFNLTDFDVQINSGQRE